MGRKIITLYRYEIIDNKIYKKDFWVYENQATYSLVNTDPEAEAIFMRYHHGELYKEDLDCIRPIENNPVCAMFTLVDDDEHYESILLKTLECQIERYKNLISSIEHKKKLTDMSEVLSLDISPLCEQYKNIKFYK